MKKVIIGIGIYLAVTATLVYHVTNPVQSEIVITSVPSERSSKVPVGKVSELNVRESKQNISHKGVCLLRKDL